MRIGILTHNYSTGKNDRQNAGIFVYDLAHKLAEKNEVFVLTPNISGKKETSKKVQVTWFDWERQDRLGDWKIYNPSTISSFIKLINNGSNAAQDFIKKNRIDVCIAMWDLPAGIWARQAQKKLGTPYLAYSLGSDINKYVHYPILGSLIKDSLNNANLCLANSFLLKEKVEHLTNKECYFSPVTTGFKAIKAAKKINLSPDSNFLFVGRLEKVKGIDILIEACKFLNSEGLKFHLYVLGSGKLESSMRKQIQLVGIESKVSLVGAANEEKVASYMKSADFLVIPSRSESLPLVLIEAAQAGLPVISFDVGDCKRVIDKYKIGEVAKNQNSESLAKVMAQVIGQDKTRYKFGLIKMSRDFNLEVSSQRLTEFIKSIYT
jgi:glycosyltransferase involved in cell wall biosynthesis